MGDVKFTVGQKLACWVPLFCMNSTSRFSGGEEAKTRFASGHRKGTLPSAWRNLRRAMACVGMEMASSGLLGRSFQEQGGVDEGHQELRDPAICGEAMGEV